MVQSDGRIETVDRHTRVGASDVPALFGLDPFKTRRELLQSKLEPQPEKEPAKIGSAIWYGNMLEDAVIGLARERMSLVGIQEQVPLRNGMLVAHPDVIASAYVNRNREYQSPCIIEIKTTGFVGQPAETWGRAGSKDGIPVRIFIQVQAELLASQPYDEYRTDTAFIALFSGHDGRGLSIYPVKYNKKAGEKIMNKVRQFWSDVLAERTRLGKNLTVEDL